MPLLVVAGGGTLLKIRPHRPLSLKRMWFTWMMATMMIQSLLDQLMLRCLTKGSRDEVKIYYPSRTDPEAVELTYSDMKCLEPEEYLKSPVINFAFSTSRNQDLTETCTCFTHISIANLRKHYPECSASCGDGGEV
uniref:Uncharacterized protein n=1 Tax=Arundo donax TaxID=35708 RepID=A0A0A9DEJ5_ARUDO